MKIKFIISAVFDSENLYLGHQNKLLVRLKQDMNFFKNTTYGHTVLMGFNTWKSMDYKLLKNRINLILTTKTGFLSTPIQVIEMIKKYYQSNNPETVSCFIDYQTLRTVILNMETELFVIGGAQVINTILQDIYLEKYIDKFYLTEILNLELEDKPDTFLDIKILNLFEKIAYSQIYQEKDIFFKFSVFKFKH